MRGEEFTGFQRREAGGRGGPDATYSERRGLKLKMRFVRDQRWGRGDDGGGGADADEGEREGAVVSAGIFAVERCSWTWSW